MNRQIPIYIIRLPKYNIQYLYEKNKFASVPYIRTPANLLRRCISLRISHSETFSYRSAGGHLRGNVGFRRLNINSQVS